MPDERNYHIFYRLLAGLSDKEKHKLHLTEAKDYHYLSQGNCFVCEGMDDAHEFLNIRRAMKVPKYWAGCPLSECMINKNYIFLIDRLHSQLNLLAKRLKVNLFRDFTTFSIKAMKLFFHFWTSFWVTDYEEQWTYSVRHRHLFGRFWCFLKKNTGQYSRF